MQTLERNLQSLHDLFLDRSALCLLNPVSIVSDINEFCMGLRDEEIGLCSSLLFNEEKGLFHFVDCALRVTENPNEFVRKIIMRFVN
jgi:hypothetical protein